MILQTLFPHNIFRCDFLKNRSSCLHTHKNQHEIVKNIFKHRTSLDKSPLQLSKSDAHVLKPSYISEMQSVTKAGRLHAIVSSSSRELKMRSDKRVVRGRAKNARRCIQTFGKNIQHNAGKTDEKKQANPRSVRINYR